MKIRKMMMIAIALTAAGSLLGCAYAKKYNEDGVEITTFKLSHYRADGSPADLALHTFADTVAATSDGTMNIEIYPAAQLGDYTVVQERVSIGDIEMQMATLGTSRDKFFGMASGPYIASTWDEAYDIFNIDSEFTKLIDEHLAEQNLKLLAVYPLYFGGVILDREPKDPANLDFEEGIKIRCQSMKGSELNARMLGYNPTPMALSDCFTALQTGVINGMIGSGAEGYWSNYRDLAYTYIAYNDHFEVCYLYCNAEIYNALSEEKKKALTEAAKALEEARWEVAPQETEEYEQKLAGNGTHVIKFTDEELNAFADKCWETVWPQLTDLYGEEAIELVKEIKGVE